MASSATDLLKNIHTDVVSTSERVQDDLRTVSRLLMSFRVNMRRFDHAIRWAKERDQALAEPHRMTVRVVEEIERILETMEHDCVNDLSTAQAAVHAVLEFSQQQAAVNVHQTNDPAVRREVLALTSGRCAYCDVELVDGGGDANQFCVEHVIPASKGGPNHLVNYVPACRSCNNSKSDNHVLLFIRRNLPRKVSIVPVQTAEAAE